MTKRILKYKLQEQQYRLYEPFSVSMYAGSELLSFGYQESDYGYGPVVWALVPDESADDANKVLRKFIIFPTGANIADNDHYIGTIITSQGLVWHLFERF